VGIGGERFDGVDAVIDEMPAAGKGDPGIAGADHVCACVQCEKQHRNPGDDYRGFAS